VYYILYTVLLHTLYYVLYTVYYILYTVYYILYSTVYYILYSTVYYMLYTVYYILYAVLLHTVYYILYTVYYILYTVYYILYIIYCILLYSVAVASYIALLIGVILQHSPDYIDHVKQFLRGKSFSQIISVLQKFLSFMKMADAASGNTGSKSIGTVLGFLREYT